jgi:hypothetical protein
LLIGQPIKNMFRRPNHAPTTITSWRPVLPDEVATASFPPPRVRGRRARHEGRFHVPVAVVSPFLPSPLTHRTDASGLAPDSSLASTVVVIRTPRTSKLGEPQQYPEARRAGAALRLAVSTVEGPGGLPKPTANVTLVGPESKRDFLKGKDHDLYCHKICMIQQLHHS